MEKVSMFRKNDIILVLVLLLLAAAGLFVFKFFHSGEGKTVRVTIDGELYGEYDLGNSNLTGDDEGGYDAVAGGVGYTKDHSEKTEKPETEISKKSGNSEKEAYKTIKIPGKIGECIMIIKDGEVYMQEADCPNQICVHHAPISHRGETIVCLPNRIIIEIL